MVVQHIKRYPGRYVAGASLLHRLDPRSKLMAVLGIIAVSFTFPRLEPIAVCLLLLAFLLRFSAIPFTHFVRLLRSLRYLFLFTLLVYLLFTPGYRLWGMSWLSRDGLQMGGLVCLKLVLALGFSVLLSTTTPPLALARGVETLLQPLKRLGIPVAQIGSALALVMYFLDMLFAELPEQPATAVQPRSLRMRLDAAVTAVGRMLERLLSHAEELALKLSRGEDLPVAEGAADCLRLAARDWYCLGFTAVLLLVLHKGWP